jgi:hypothetical protein
MTLTFETTDRLIRPLRSFFLTPLHRIYVAILAARQRQADIRVATHLRDMPDDLLKRLGVSKSHVEGLRDLQR